MHKAIVTGGMGFIGKHVVSELLKNNFRVLIIDNLETSGRNNSMGHPSRKIPIAPINPTSVSQGPPPGFAGLLEVDLNTYPPEQLTNVMRGVKYVFHLAALPRVEPSIKDPAKYHASNVDVALKVFISAKDAGVERVIFSSSSSVYGDAKIFPTPEDHELNPMSPYALHKQIGEQYLELFHELYKLNSVSLRYFNVYGEGQPTEGAYVPVMGIFFRQIRAGQHMSITGDGQQTRDFVNVIDVASANLAAATADLEPGHHIFNIASGQNDSIKSIAAKIGSRTVSIQPRFEPHVTLADISKAKEKLNWEPTIDLMDWIEHNKP